MNGQIRITEQGEIISSKYSNAEVGRRNLETLAAATFEATLLQVERPVSQAWRAVMEELSAGAFRAYRALVYETEGFRTFFRQATPIDALENSRIGSRPPRRSASNPTGPSVRAIHRIHVDQPRLRTGVVLMAATIRTAATVLELMQSSASVGRARTGSGKKIFLMGD